MNVAEIIAAAKQINPTQVANDVLCWLIENVETFIDNKETVFPLYFTEDSLVDMPSLKQLRELYKEVNEEWPDEDVGNCMSALDAVVMQAKNEMNNASEDLAALYQRMIYFYEMRSLVSDGQQVIPIIQNLAGSVVINEFLYEPIKLNIQVMQKFMRKKADGSLEDAGLAPVPVKTESQPEGFILELELMYWQDTISGLSL